VDAAGGEAPGKGEAGCWKAGAGAAGCGKVGTGVVDWKAGDGVTGCGKAGDGTAGGGKAGTGAAPGAWKNGPGCGCGGTPKENGVGAGDADKGVVLNENGACTGDIAHSRSAISSENYPEQTAGAVGAGAPGGGGGAALLWAVNWRVPVVVSVLGAMSASSSSVSSAKYVYTE